MNERQRLLNKIKKYDFSLKELNLYLDTHPDCRRALALFNNHQTIRQNCIEEYNRRFGPLTPDQSNEPQHWSWDRRPVAVGKEVNYVAI